MATLKNATLSLLLACFLVTGCNQVTPDPCSCPWTSFIGTSLQEKHVQHVGQTLALRHSQGILITTCNIVSPWQLKTLIRFFHLKNPHADIVLDERIPALTLKKGFMDVPCVPSHQPAKGPWIQAVQHAYDRWAQIVRSCNITHVILESPKDLAISHVQLLAMHFKLRALRKAQVKSILVPFRGHEESARLLAPQADFLLCASGTLPLGTEHPTKYLTGECMLTKCQSDAPLK